MATTLVYDNKFENLPILSDLIEGDEHIRRYVSVTAECSLEEVISLSNQLRRSERVLVFGGGGVIDKTKLALLNQEVSISNWVKVGRAGLVLIPSCRNVRLVAIPTTLGTGSEANSKAVLEVSEGRRRLVFSPGLKPMNFSYVPQVYMSLSDRQILYGVLEVFMRIVGIYSVMDVDNNKLDALLDEAIRLIRQTRLTDNPQKDLELMTEIAKLSGYTHMLQINHRGILWVWPLWYVANELSSLAKITKMEATVALAPLITTRMENLGYGNTDRILCVQEKIGQTLECFLLDVAGGLDDRVINHIVNLDVRHLVNQTFDQWAGRNLALYKATHSDLFSLFQEMKLKYVQCS